MIMQGQFNKSSLMMGTEEIAALTGKNHDLVIKKARTMINVLISQSVNLKASKGAGWRESLFAPGERAPHRTGRLKELFLDHELTLCLVTDRIFSQPQRLTVIRRWEVMQAQHQRIASIGARQHYQASQHVSM